MSINLIYLSRARDRFHAEMPLFPSEREVMGDHSCFVDGNSIVRNTASAFGVVPALCAASLAAGGALGIPIGLSGTRVEWKKGAAALEHRDAEGVAHHALAGTGCLSYAGISGLCVAEGGMALGSAAIPAAMGSAFGGLGLGMYGAFTIYGVHGLLRSRSFGKKFASFGSEEEKLNWLRDQITLTSEEAEKSDALQILERKWNVFERRTSPDCAKKIRNYFIHHKGERKELIQEVEKANFMAQMRFGLLILISIVGIAAFVAMMILLGPFSPILFAVGAALWLTLDSSKLHNLIGEKCWAWQHGDKPCQVPCQIPCQIKG